MKLRTQRNTKKEHNNKNTKEKMNVSLHYKIDSMPIWDGLKRQRNGSECVVHRVNDVLKGFLGVFNGFRYILKGFEYVFNGFRYVLKGFEYVFNGFRYVLKGFLGVFNGFRYVLKGFLGVFNDSRYVLKVFEYVINDSRCVLKEFRDILNHVWDILKVANRQLMGDGSLGLVDGKRSLAVVYGLT